MDKKIRIRKEMPVKRIKIYCFYLASKINFKDKKIKNQLKIPKLKISIASLLIYALIL
jgi:coproporphyrinogen III oxidase-like Fe-S oxidoreductase